MIVVLDLSHIYIAYAAHVRMSGDLRGDSESPLKHPHQILGSAQSAERLPEFDNITLSQ